MASSSRSTTPRTSLVSLGGALLAGLFISASSSSARAEPIPPPPVIAPYGYAPRSQEFVAPAYQVPTYVYLPGAGMQGYPGSTEPGGKHGWYGWQTLLVFGGSTTVALIGGIAGGTSDSPGVLLTSLSLGGAGFLFGGPIIHWAHGHTSKGLGALGLNFGLPLVGGGLGVATACIAGGCGNRSAGIGILLGLVIGGSAGLLASMVVDVSVLSYEETGSGPTIASRRAPTWTILPDLKITRDKTTFGFAGVF